MKPYAFPTYNTFAADDFKYINPKIGKNSLTEDIIT